MSRASHARSWPGNGSRCANSPVGSALLVTATHFRREAYPQIVDTTVGEKSWQAPRGPSALQTRAAKKAAGARYSLSTRHPTCSYKSPASVAAPSDVKSPSSPPRVLTALTFPGERRITLSGARLTD